MARLASPTQISVPWNRFGPAGEAVLLGLSAALLGLGFAFLAGRAGDAAPIVMLAPLVPLLIVLILVWPRVGIITVFAAFPLGLVFIPVGPLRLQAVDAAVIVVGALIALRRLGAGQTPLSWSPPLGFAVAFFGWSVFVFPSAPDHQLAVRSVGSLLYGIAFASLVLAACRDMEDVRRVLSALVAIAAGIALYAITTVGSLHAEYGGQVISGRATGVFGEPNELGAFCALTSLVAIALALSARTTRGRVLASLATTILLVGLVLSLSRGAWFGVAAGALVFVLSLRRARRTAAVVILPILCLVGVAAVFQPARPAVDVVGERVSSITSLTYTYERRPTIWAEAVRQVRDDVLMGSGPGNFRVPSRRYAYGSSFVYAPHAHNLYLNTAAELGVPGLALLLALMGAIAVAGRHALRFLNSQGRLAEATLVVGAAAALVSVAMQGLVNTFLGNVIIDTTMWGLVGVILVALREAKRGEKAGAVTSR